ncbi:MAG: glycosyltransferase family 1 protein [Candidatus Helarchaeota archaeon]|nr:glycosyltransferase family 1 protein [Candidatus Helarchaeota archaeon]
MYVIKKVYKDLITNSFFLYVLSRYLKLPIKQNFNKIINYVKKIPNFYSIKKKLRKRNEKIIFNSKIYPKIGIIFNLNSHLDNKWIVGLTKYLINTIIRELTCILIENQHDYNHYKDYLDVIIALEPGFCGPFIKYEKGKPKLKYVITYDPWVDTNVKQRYFLEASFSFILVGYYNPALFHFKNISKEKIIHFPWAIPDNFINKKQIKTPTQDYIMVFGESRTNVYETRNWCKKFDFVKSHSRSGAYKVVTGLDYFNWLAEFNAIIAATSLKPKFRHTVAKYFEIPASGALLFAQEAEDLALLGFKDNENCIIFNKENFKQKVYDYLENKVNYVKFMENGRKLILEKHTLSKRINFLKEHINKNL